MATPTTTTDTKNVKPKKTLKQELAEPAMMPLWVLLFLLGSTTLAGYGGGVADAGGDATGVFVVAGLLYFAVLAKPAWKLARKRVADRKAALAADKAAVSPVIGVILMVAITVVLAAIVYVMVSNLAGGGAEDVPNFALQFDEANRTAASFTVSAIDGPLWWSEVRFRDGAGETLEFTVNNHASTEAEAGQVRAGDVVTFSGLQAEKTYTVRAIIGDYVVWTGRAQTLA